MFTLGILFATSVGLVPSGPPADPLAVVHGWDAQRAAAYLADDASALRDLYAPGAAAGRADVRVLAAYDRRGVRVTALTPQVFEVHVLARAPASLRVRVRGRVGATADDGRRCVRLLASPVTTRDLVLRREETRWVMVAVRAVRQPGGADRSPEWR